MKVSGTLVCDNAPCTYTENVDDMTPHMDANCPQCGAPLMNDNDRAAFGVLQVLMRSGALAPVPRGTGEFTVNSKEDWIAQVEAGLALKQ